MSEVAKINPIERTRHVEVPEPAVGHVIVRKIAIEQYGRILLPDETQQGEQKHERLRVVKAATHYMNGITLMETPFGAGDFVICKPGTFLGASHELPKDHRVIAVSDVVAYHPCPTAAPKGDA